MLILSKDKRQIYLRKLQPDDFDKLEIYLRNLSVTTQKQFGPHQFDRSAIEELYKKMPVCGYIGIDIKTAAIIAYSVIQKGYLKHDSSRLQSYGISLSYKNDCTYAPSVADEWQSFGVGQALFHFMLEDIKSNEIKRVILWGGVQAANERAVNFYKKNAFKILGQFCHQGDNYDMILDLL